MPHVLAAVQSGGFASVEDAIAKDWLSFQQTNRPPAPATGAGLIGALRDDAGLLDQGVEHAMKVREERPWRLAPGGGSRQRNESISVERADAATVGWAPGTKAGMMDDLDHMSYFGD